jgi:single-strand DNA-binding protein
MGRLGKDPEVRRLENGTPCASFSLATSKKYKTANGEPQEKTQWHRVVGWRSHAELFEKVTVQKGDLILIDGEIEYRKYTDQNGVEKEITEIIISSITLMGGGKKSESDQSKPAPQAEKPAPTQATFADVANTPLVVDEVPRDDLPF